MRNRELNELLINLADSDSEGNREISYARAASAYSQIIAMQEKAVTEARKDQVMRDELSLSNDARFDDIDEFMFIAWREERIATLTNQPERSGND